jgi:putative transposase
MRGGTGQIFRRLAIFNYTFIVCCVISPDNLMRLPRVKSDGRGLYHCISRAVHSLFIFRTSGHGSEEADRFVRLMRGIAAFCGVQVLDYVLMSNHFHLLCEVPEPVALSETEVLNRIEAGYGPARRQAVQKQLDRYRQQPDGTAEIERILDRYRKRMFDLSVFIKELKGRFAQWYNQRHGRYGALWAERFKSLLVEGGEALAAVAAYIELNPVRVGLCTDPKDYRYSGYAEAIGKACPIARQGIRTILGQPETVSWAELGCQYRRLLFVAGSSSRGGKPPAFDLATVRQVVEQQEGEIPFPQSFLCQIKYFSDGVILGSQAFVESHIERLKEKFCFKRTRTARPVTELDSKNLWAFRGPRVRRTG